MKFPYSRQKITSTDIKNVNKVLRSKLITQGPVVKKLEQKLKKLFKAKYSICVNSATSGLHLACMAIGLKENDILWTVSNTFVSSANCGRLCGATIDFLDINLETYNVDINILKKKLILAKFKKKLPKVIVIVHFAGQPVEIEEIFRLSKIYKFKIIEDASHALGAKRNKEPIGSCKYSHIAVFSFHPVKIITTGEGGAVLTNNKLFHDKIEMLRSHGITRNFKKYINKNKTKDYWYYEQQFLGFNYRMSDINAGLGLSQLKRLNSIIKKRQSIAARYDKMLKGLPIFLPKIQDENFSSFHLYVIRLTDKFVKSYSKIFDYLRKKGIMINLHYPPVHQQPYYLNLFKKKLILKNSELYSKSSFSIPVYEDLKFADQYYIVKNLKKALSKFI